MLPRQLHEVRCSHKPESKLRPRFALACWDALKLWAKPFFLWKCFCINSLAYLFRHLERTPNPSSTFTREKHLLPDWPVTDSRGWWQPGHCSPEDWEVPPSWNVPTLGIRQAQLRGATKLQRCWGPGWGWEGCRKTLLLHQKGPVVPVFSLVTTTWWH